MVVASHKRWPDETIQHFVNLYSSFECLWNTRSPLYKDRKVRNSALESLSEEMNVQGFGILEAKCKINNIRSSYIQELKKIAKKKQNGEHYEPSIIWFKTMDSFLRPFITQRDRMPNFNSKNENEMDGTGEEDFDSDTVQDRTDDSDALNDRDILCEAIIETPKVKPSTNKRKKTEDDSVDSTVNRSPELLCGSFDEDLFDVFGQSVASQLKSLPLRHALATQLKLQTILTEELLQNCINGEISSCRGHLRYRRK